MPIGRKRPLGRSPLLRAVLDGLLVVVPMGAVVLLVLGILRALRDATAPLAGQFVHPMIVGTLLFFVICLAVGYLVRSAIGHAVRRTLETTLFERLPGYRLVKAFAAQELLPGEAGGALRPAIAAFDDAQSPALVMDTLPDGRLLVFVPGSPTAMSGSLHVMTVDRVALLDVPLMPFLKAISSWGLGLAALMAPPPPTEARRA